MKPQPILVTGMPRSGTTWLARELARSPQAALTGREPMNPRGRQYALGGTLSGWTRLTTPTQRQKFLLRQAFAGLNPWVYSRYGYHQWWAPLPWVRVIVKDPFAMLSLPAITETTDARVVLVYRHPGAVLASFRRIGWAPDPEEVRKLENLSSPVGALAQPETDLHLIARMWTVLHQLALEDLDGPVDGIVVSHEKLACGGYVGLHHLRTRLGLALPGERPEAEAPAQGDMTPDSGRLHNLDRDPKTVARAWRDTIQPGELAWLEDTCGSLLANLNGREFHVS
ncbi:sulfotransferase [Ornithinimicrobium murale]|uniref:sulfotransferase n=1 Tax=Ornithinimicrobium murale TaxID=1050153 RepID=UPI000E0DF7C5|nr:sulfotransferase [Ornithinimicrobium murale]